MFNFNVDRRPNKNTAVKGQHVFPITRFSEVMRPGIARWPAIKAQNTLTFVANPANGESVTIGSKTYTFLNSISTDGHVKLGATLAETIRNLANAINLDGVPGSEYANSTTLNSDVEAVYTATTLTVTAKLAGTAANSLATTETMSNPGNVWAGATLSAGRAGAAEGLADSLLVPAYYGGVQPYANQQYNLRDNFYIGGGESDGSDERWVNNRHGLPADFPMGSYKTAASGSRKMKLLNYYDRRYKDLLSVKLFSYLSRPLWTSLASPFTEHANNVLFKTIELDTTRFIAFIRSGNGNAIWAVVGQVAANGSITWGTPVQVTGLDQYDANFDAALVSTDKVLVTHGHGASTYIHCTVISVAALIASVGTQTQVTTVNSGWKKLVTIGTDKALLAFNNGANTTVYVVSVSGTTPSFGSAATITGGQNPWLAANGTDKAQVAYSASSKMNSAVITVVGTTSTVQTGIVIGHEVSAGYGAQWIQQVATDKFVYHHPQGQLGNYRGRDRYKFIMLTVSGNTTSTSDVLYVDNGVVDPNVNYIKSMGSNVWAHYNVPQRRVAKLTVDTTNNKLTYMDIPWYINMRDHDVRPEVVWQRAETNNIQRTADPISTSNGLIILGTDNNVGGGVIAMVDKTFSFSLYDHEDLIGTYTKSIPFAVETVQTPYTFNADELELKLKNNDSQELTIWVEGVNMTIE